MSVRRFSAQLRSSRVEHIAVLLHVVSRRTRKCSSLRREDPQKDHSAANSWSILRLGSQHCVTVVRRSSNAFASCHSDDLRCSRLCLFRIGSRACPLLASRGAPSAIPNDSTERVEGRKRVFDGHARRAWLHSDGCFSHARLFGASSAACLRFLARLSRRRG